MPHRSPTPCRRPRAVRFEFKGRHPGRRYWTAGRCASRPATARHQPRLPGRWPSATRWAADRDPRRRDRALDEAAGPASESSRSACTSPRGDVRRRCVRRRPPTCCSTSTGRRAAPQRPLHRPARASGALPCRRHWQRRPPSRSRAGADAASPRTAWRAFAKRLDRSTRRGAAAAPGSGQETACARSRDRGWVDGRGRAGGRRLLVGSGGTATGVRTRSAPASRTRAAGLPP